VAGAPPFFVCPRGSGFVVGAHDAELVALGVGQDGPVGAPAPAQVVEEGGAPGEQAFDFGVAG